MAGRFRSEAVADQLIRDEYERLKRDVIANARAKLVVRNLRFPAIDLEALYNAAWHGLYQAVVDGIEEIENPGGWLVVAMERRALDEVRRIHPGQFATLPEDSTLADGVVELDFAAQLDDMDRIRRWRTGIRLRLSRRERETAVLHFIRGFTRIEISELLGLPVRRVNKIFDSISAKTDGLLAAIDDGSWCESERSLMAAFSAGVLDPGGERHAVALQHLAECPGCAAFVRRLRTAYLIIPAPAVAGVATAAGGGSLGAALGLAEVTTTGAGAGVTAGGAGLFGGITAKTAVMCASAVCLTGAGASVAVVESVRPPSGPAPARAARAPKPAGGSAAPNTTISPRPVTASLPRSTSATSPADPPPASGQSTTPAQPAAKPRSKPDPQQDAQARRAAVQRQQESELGIEGGGSTAGTGSAASSGTGSTSSGASGPASVSGASSSSSSAGSTAAPAPQSAPPPAPDPPTRTPSSGGSSGGGASEIGIEP